MNDFLESIKKSFIKSLETGPRSNEKLKILHGFIARDLKAKLGSEYEIKSLGFSDGKEAQISGRYMDKNVDITIKKNRKSIAGVAIKFVMSNYSQNSNNYFENMLGETANLRASKVPYFQIFILPEKLPYYDKQGNIKKWESITANNLSKYIRMSEDNVDAYFHTPNKTLFVLISLGEFKCRAPHTSQEFIEYYLSTDFELKYSTQSIVFNNQTIYNDYSSFIDKVFHSIKAL